MKGRIRSKSPFADRGKVEDLAGMLSEQGLIVDRILEDEEHSLFEVAVTCLGETKECATINWDN